MSILRNSIQKPVNYNKGYNTDNESYYFYNRLGKVLYYDPILKTVDIKWLDNFRSQLKVPVSIDISVSVGDVLVFSALRDVFSTGKYVVVGKMPILSDPSKIGALYWDSISKEYDFSYDRFTENKDAHITSDFSELALDTQVNLASGLSRITLDSSSGFLSEYSSGNYSYNGGIYNSTGPILRLSSFYSFDKNSPVYYLNPFLEHKVNPNSRGDLYNNLIFLEDSDGYSYVDKNYSKQSSIDSIDLSLMQSQETLLREFSDLDPLKTNDNDLIDENFFRVETNYNKSFFIQKGSGTFVGRNLDNSVTFNSVLARSVFKDADLAIEEDKDDRLLPINDKSFNFLSIASWFSLFRKGIEKFFFNLDKRGAAYFKLSSSNDDNKKINSALEGIIDGRTILSLSKNDDTFTKNMNTLESPNFELNERGLVRGESLYLKSESSLNIDVDGSDSSSTSFFLNLKDGDFKLRVNGNEELHILNNSKRKVTGNSYRFFDQNDYVSTLGDHVSEVIGDVVVQGTSQTYVVDSGSPFKINFGGSVDRDSGTVSGGLSVTITSSGNTVNVDWGGASVNFLNASKLTTDHYLSANYGATPAAKRGDLVIFSGNADVHANHRVQNPPSSVGVSESVGGLITRV